MAHVDWRVAYDHQMDLWSWWQTPAGYRVAEGYMNAIVERGAGTTTQIGRLVEGQQEILFRADPVVLDDDMMTLIEAAAPDFPPEPLREEDLLTPTAFVWLPRPLMVLDGHEKWLTIRAIAWGPVAFRTESGKEPQKGLMLAYYSWLGDADQDDLGEDMHMFARAMGSDLSMVHWEPWLFGEDYKANEVPGSPGVTLRFIQTMWRLMQQTIVTHTRERPGRAERRRAEKRGMADKVVTVIRLRRPKKPLAEDHETKAVDWTHRWITRGHWRNQWFPSLGEAADATAHRSIWISQYVKGPEDKPLIAPKLRAFEWTR